jgi:hypothetical protein
MNAVALNRDWDFIEGQLRYINVETARQFYDVFMNYMHAWRGTGTSYGYYRLENILNT